MATPFEKFVGNNLKGRSWPQIAIYWLSFVELPSTPIPVPDEDLTSNYTIAAEALRFHYDDTDLPFQFIEAPGIRKVAFDNALFLIYKGINILESVENDISRGYFTTASISAYHSSYQLVKAINMFLGVSLLEIRDEDKNTIKPTIIDLYTSREYPKRKEGDPAYRAKSHEFKIELLKFGSSFSQKNTWAVFQRLMKSTQGLPFKNVVKFLSEVPVLFFSMQRNDAFYIDNLWLFDDLIDSLSDVSEISIESISFKSKHPIGKDSYFIIVVNILLLRLARQLLADISVNSKEISNELNFIDDLLGNGSYSNYLHESFDSM